MSMTEAKRRYLDTLKKEVLNYVSKHFSSSFLEKFEEYWHNNYCVCAIIEDFKKASYYDTYTYDELVEAKLIIQKYDILAQMEVDEYC